MAEEEKKKFKVVRAHGIEVKALRGGFYAYCKNRNGKVEKIEVREKKFGFLLCKECGTVIRVSPPDRLARCCKVLMTPLVEKEEEEEEASS